MSLVRLLKRTQVRFASTGGPRASLVPLTSPVQQLFYKTPPAAKYFSIIVAIAVSIRHLHPNTLITLGPPTGLVAWTARRKWDDFLYRSNIAKVYPMLMKEATDPNNQVELEPYDETDIDNVLFRGVENEFDHFKAQLLPLLERKLVDHMATNRNISNEGGSTTQPDRTPGTSSSDSVVGLFVENEQVLARLSVGAAAATDLDTFLVLPMKEKFLPYTQYTSEVLQRELEGPNGGSEVPQFDKFIKLSLPYYQTVQQRQQLKRVATVEVFLLHHALRPNTYKVAVLVTRYGLFGESMHIRNFDADSDDSFVYI